MSADGLITIRSGFGPEDTKRRFEAGLKARGLTIFAKVDHAAGAAAVELALRPTELIIFGNARGGTPLMQAAQTAGIDLPLKALIWEDSSGVTWLSYNDPNWIAQRHRLGTEATPVLHAMTRLLDELAAAATDANDPII